MKTDPWVQQPETKSHKEYLKQLEEERNRIEKEVSLTYLYNFCKDFVTKYEDENLKRGNLTLNFPQQYESDEWKIGVKTYCILKNTIV